MGLRCELQTRFKSPDHFRAYASLGYLRVGEWRGLVR
jgi:hypothetical protein